MLSLLHRPSFVSVPAATLYSFLFPTPHINYRTHHELYNLVAEILLYDSCSTLARSGILEKRHGVGRLCILMFFNYKITEVTDVIR